MKRGASSCAIDLIAFASLVPLAAAVVGAVLTLSGCAGDAAAQHAAAPPPAPQVTVARVISRTVTDSETFSGRFDAVNHVDIRPRVSGYISSVNFVDGTVVHKGQVLFVIDPRPYQAEYQRAEADLDQARAQAALAKSEQVRAVNLYCGPRDLQETSSTPAWRMRASPRPTWKLRRRRWTPRRSI